MTLRELALELRAGMGPRARRAPRIEMPDVAIRALALIHPVARGVLPELGKRKNATSGKARRMLGWAPRSLRESLVACGESLIARGLVRRA